MVFKDRLNNMISFQAKNYYFDLFGGLMGSLLSVLSIPNNKSLIDTITNHFMSSIGEYEDECIILNSNFSDNYKTILCFPYGLSGFLVILGEVYKINSDAKIYELMQKIYKYLCIFLKCSEKPKFFFPMAIMNNGESIFKDNSWLSGDLGILYSLLYSSQLFGDERTEIDIIKALKMSLEPIDKSVAGFGYSGYLSNAFISKIIYKKTRDSYFNKKSNKILYEYIDIIGNEVKSYGLINGIVGTSLMLLSFASNMEIEWEESVMLF